MHVDRKGLVLAGGNGTRLSPLTLAVSKQLLPVFDKPMIYYPITTLMLAKIREILLITSPQYLPSFQHLLGDGSRWGLEIQYVVQPSPDGIAQAFLLGENFIGQSHSALILGDNIFYGNSLQSILLSVNSKSDGATVFAYHVSEPERYGILKFNTHGEVTGIEEKPEQPSSSFAIPGLYFYDNRVTDMARELKPSSRGELEITDINRKYLEQGELSVKQMGRGIAWLDVGTHESLLEANLFVQTIQHRQGLKIACPEEIAYRNKWITPEQVEQLAASMTSEYGNYLKNILKESS